MWLTLHTYTEQLVFFNAPVWVLVTCTTHLLSDIAQRNLLTVNMGF